MAPADLRAELERRKSNAQRMVVYFRANQGKWIDSRVLENVGGRNAWRTRVSNARKVFCLEMGWEFPVKDGPDPIQNRQYNVGDLIVSEYRYWPHKALGRDATVPLPDRWPVYEAPSQDAWTLKP